MGELGMLDHLPGLFHEREDATSAFLTRFLAAFETVFADVEDEIEAVPRLFSLAPTPFLATSASAGHTSIRLDSAAGICPGDVLQLEDVNRRVDEAIPPHVEFVEIAANGVRGTDPPAPSAAVPSPPPGLLP